MVDIESRPLNKEQERAFCIIANHISLTSQKQLLTYLGGMGGTGKTKVVTTLISFFEEREEAHRFKVVAPTGSAAALLGGDTYHSAIGINDREESNKISDTALGKVRDNLSGVLDKVSMFSCRDRVKISKRLANVTGNHEVTLGGMNMIFAGEFAQLSPVTASQNSCGTYIPYIYPHNPIQWSTILTEAYIRIPEAYKGL